MGFISEGVCYSQSGQKKNRGPRRKIVAGCFVVGKAKARVAFIAPSAIRCDRVAERGKGFYRFLLNYRRYLDFGIIFGYFGLKTERASGAYQGFIGPITYPTHTYNIYKYILSRDFEIPAATDHVSYLCYALNSCAIDSNRSSNIVARHEIIKRS